MAEPRPSSRTGAVVPSSLPPPDHQDGEPSTSTTPPLPKPQQLPPGQHFTLRGVVVGLAVGLVICFSNMYFGLQTGWVSIMTMPSSLMGFGIFQLLRPHLGLDDMFPFSPVENVLVQSVAGGMAIMPLGCGFVGVMPAMNYLLTPEEQGPVFLSLWKMIIWSLGLCYFGVVFAVPLRRQVIIKEKLKFPSGFSTAVLISVLHGKGQIQAGSTSEAVDPTKASTFGSLAMENQALPQDPDDERRSNDGDEVHDPEPPQKQTSGGDWAQNIRLLIITFTISGVYTLCTYFLPVLRKVPVFGTYAMTTWLWDLNPSLAYVGQGIIMGPATTLHMLLGAIVGWAILSPLAKSRGWAPGAVSDWENGSKGWIVWVSLAIMLVDAVVSLGYISLKPVVEHGPDLWATVRQRYQKGSLISRGTSQGDGGGEYSAIRSGEDEEQDDENGEQNPRTSVSGLLSSPTVIRRLRHYQSHGDGDRNSHAGPAPHTVTTTSDDAPPDHLVSNQTVILGLLASIALCVLCVHITFGALIPLYATFLAVLMALVLSIMGVRALGETDLNPVSGISKLAQLFFALLLPTSSPASVLTNLIAGAISEAGALQAGDLMQDLKTGHLLGAAPRAQFWGQVIGASVGAVVSALIYRLYTNAYQIPGQLFEVPTAYVWVFTARLVTGRGLPDMAGQWAVGAGVLFAGCTGLRIWGRRGGWDRWWVECVPGGIAVAVGMYNVPSFTLARTIGGLAGWYWRTRLGRDNTALIILASGFILGEGVLSIVNLMLQTARVPHL